MRRASKLAASVAVTAALALTATACGESSTSSNNSGSDAKGDAGVGLAFDVGGRDDHSFNESAARGLDRAEEELGISFKEMTAKNDETEADREQRLTSLAENGYNPIIGVGYLYGSSIEKVAAQYPDITFGVVDSVVEGDNVYSMVFSEHEGSYLAGVAAALKTESGQVGFIGGVNNPLINKFEAGFVQGVLDTNENEGTDVSVDVQYLYEDNDAGFNDVAKARETADGMLGRGADIIYTAAGQSGQGSIETVAGVEGAWAIGVDSDAYEQPGLAEYKDSILTSVVKGVDVAVFDLIKSVQDGEPLSGPHSYNLEEGGVSLATSGGFIDDISEQIEAAKARIVSGEVTVQETP